MLQHLDTMIAFAAVMLGVSIIITALTQMMNAVLQLRGKNLIWGLQTLLKNIDSKFEKHAQALVNSIVEHPLVSHSKAPDSKKRFLLPTVVRREEFLALLPEAIEKIDELKNKIDLLPESFGTLKRLPQEYLSKIEFWFDRVMDRASERFAMHSRWITIILSIIAAFALHLDAMHLLKQLSTDPQLRAALVNQSNAMLQHQKILEAASAQVYSEAVMLMCKQSKDTLANRLAPPPNFNSEYEAKQWIRSQISDSMAANHVIRDYKMYVQTVLKERIGTYSAIADSVQLELANAGFKLIPTSCKEWTNYDIGIFAGIVISSILLSLGAPFWFNVLRNLSNLRPRLAQLIDKEASKEKPEEKKS